MFATKRVGQFSDGIDRELAELAQLSQSPAVHTTALAIDPQRWETVRFTLWTTTPDEDSDVQYRVLHLSRPNIDLLS